MMSDPDKTHVSINLRPNNQDFSIKEQSLKYQSSCYGMLLSHESPRRQMRGINFHPENSDERGLVVATGPRFDSIDLRNAEGSRDNQSQLHSIPLGSDDRGPSNVIDFINERTHQDAIHQSSQAHRNNPSLIQRVEVSLKEIQDIFKLPKLAMNSQKIQPINNFGFFRNIQHHYYQNKDDDSSLQLQPILSI